MTVCIAAVCNMGQADGTFVVAASDRMITIGDIEYEPEQSKAVELGSSTIGLFAGEMEVHAAVIPKARERIADIVSERDPQRLTVEEIAQAYALEFAYYRRVLAEREVLIPRGLDFDRWARMQSTLPHYQVQEIDARLTTRQLNASAIIAGLDHTGPHIYKVRDPGVAESFDTPYFACIGTGSDIATTQFMLAKFEKRWPLASALWLTFSAKARAEVAGGVGPQTDLIVVGPNKIVFVGADQKDQLYRMFNDVTKKERAAQDEAVANLTEYLGQTPHDPTQQANQQATPDDPVTSKEDSASPAVSAFARPVSRLRRKRSDQAP
ncbi:MAG: hypothetical protein U1E49_16555 [Hyphomicrobiaceae bacterium]